MLKLVFHLAIFFARTSKKANVIGHLMMSSVFVASQSSCFFLRSREQIRLIENSLKAHTLRGHVLLSKFVVSLYVLSGDSDILKMSASLYHNKTDLKILIHCIYLPPDQHHEDNFEYMEHDDKLGRKSIFSIVIWQETTSPSQHTRPTSKIELDTLFGSLPIGASQWPITSSITLTVTKA